MRASTPHPSPGPLLGRARDLVLLSIPLDIRSAPSEWLTPMKLRESETLESEPRLLTHTPSLKNRV